MRMNIFVSIRGCTADVSYFPLDMKIEGCIDVLRDILLLRVSTRAP
jgi:hypothetical protein